MLGFGDKQAHTIDPTILPIFVHSIGSSEGFELARKVWQTNSRYTMLDNGNHKELLRFVFSEPECVVWLQRDQGRQDTFELILLWDSDASGKAQNVTEVYVVTLPVTGAPTGDDTRAKSLLNAILATPATVPVNSSRDM